MPIVKLDTRRELVSLEFHYGSYEARFGGPPESWSPGCDPFNPCWCETVCLVFSVSSCEKKKTIRAPIIRDIAEVRSSFITIDQLQQVRFQLTKNIRSPHSSLKIKFFSSYTAPPARAAVPNPVIQLLCAPQPQSAHCCPHFSPHSPHSPLPYPSCLHSRGCLQSHAHAARCRRRRHRVHPRSTGGCSASTAALHWRPLEIHVWRAPARQPAV